MPGIFKHKSFSNKKNMAWFNLENQIYCSFWPFTILTGLGFFMNGGHFLKQRKNTFWRLRFLMNSFRQIAISMRAINEVIIAGFLKCIQYTRYQFFVDTALRYSNFKLNLTFEIFLTFFANPFSLKMQKLKFKPYPIWILLSH